MNSLFNIVKATVVGVFNSVALIFFVIAIYAQTLSFMSALIIIIAVSMLQVFIRMYQQYKYTQAGVKQLLFAPTESHKTLFEDMIRQTGMNPETVNVRYAWSNQMIAVGQLDTISLDPYFWSLISNDPESDKCHAVLKAHIEPTLSPIALERLAACKAAFSTDAQKFLFRHELSHIKARDGIKRLWVTGIILTLIIALSCIIGLLLIPHIGKLASFAVVIIVGTFLDLVLSYGLLNRLKYNEERSADDFACQWSSKEEIEAAALFFKKFDEIIAVHDERIGIIRNLPLSFFSGHPSNKERSVRLMAYAQKLKPATK